MKLVRRLSCHWCPCIRAFLTVSKTATTCVPAVGAGSYSYQRRTRTTNHASSFCSQWLWRSITVIHERPNWTNERCDQLFVDNSFRPFVVASQTTAQSATGRLTRLF